MKDENYLKANNARSLWHPMTSPADSLKNAPAIIVSLGRAQPVAPDTRVHQAAVILLELAAQDRSAELEEELAKAKQDVLYAKAETQNVRRRLEKDVADAKAYGATGFARDILSVADNLARALEAIPASMREGSVRIVVERAYTVHPLFSGAAPRWRHRSTNHHPPIGPRCVEAIQMPARRRASASAPTSA